MIIGQTLPAIPTLELFLTVLRFPMIRQAPACRKVLETFITLVHVHNVGMFQSPMEHYRKEMRNESIILKTPIRYVYFRIRNAQAKQINIVLSS